MEDKNVICSPPRAVSHISMPKHLANCWERETETLVVTYFFVVVFLLILSNTHQQIALKRLRSLCCFFLVHCHCCHAYFCVNLLRKRSNKQSITKLEIERAPTTHKILLTKLFLPFRLILMSSIERQSTPLYDFLFTLWTCRISSEKLVDVWFLFEKELALTRFYSCIDLICIAFVHSFRYVQI